jgi:hypothetical protein
MATQAGNVSLPLSQIHYMELSAPDKREQRQEIAPLMFELSRQHTMLSMSKAILAMEVDLALQKRTGRPLQPRRVLIFGEGIGHAMGRPDLKLELRDLEGNRPTGLSPELLLQEQKFQRLAEYMLLAGPPPGADVPGYLPNAHTIYDVIFARQEAAFARRLAAMPLDKHEDMHRARLWAEDLLEALQDALRNAGLPFDTVPLDSKEALTSFAREVPTPWTLTELKRVRHADPSYSWKPQDHADLNFLVVALNYCDAVFPDKAWGDAIRRAS